MPGFYWYMYDQYMALGEASGSGIDPPPTDPLPLQVLVAVQERGIPRDLWGLIAAFIRPSYTEYVCKHLRFWLLCAEQDERESLKKRYG